MSEREPKVMSLNPSGITVLPDRMRRLRPEVVSELAESIKTRKLLQPIVVRTRPRGGLGYILIAGWHRLMAVRELKQDSIRALVLDGIDADQAMLAEIDENLIRADLTTAERAMHIGKRKELYDAQPDIPKHGGDRRSKKSKSQNENLKDFVKATAEKTGKGRSTVARDLTRVGKVAVLGEIVGTSLDKGDEIDALAKLSPKEQQVLARAATKGKKVSAKTRVKQVRRQQRELALAEKTAGAAIALGQEIPASVILVDWALRFKVRSEHGEDRSPENHYLCGSVEEMIALKPPMADDVVVFAWTSAPQLENSMTIMRKWGIKYKSYSGWDKEIDGTGYWSLSRLELILIGTNGNIPAPAPGEQFPQLFRSRRREHSRKPDEVYEAIERLYPNLVKLEMFARNPRPGWRSWGNEATEGTQDEAAE